MGMPTRFQIATPLGAYDPDWAVVLDQQGTTRFYIFAPVKDWDGFMDLVMAKIEA